MIITRYLLTGYYFNGYHGSMMHLCEIGEYLLSQGNEVDIVSVVIEDEIRSYVENKGIKLFSVDAVVENAVYDYALCYHYPVLPLILEKGVQIGKIVFGSLSTILPLELPSLLLGRKYFLHVHSRMAKEFFVEKYGISEEQVFVMPNLVKDDFFSVEKICNRKLRKIAVVSNHVSTEVRELQRVMSQREIEVTYYGVQDLYVPITKEILCEYDCIISIGKTVQYALALGIPVFLYDYFGGNGYITLKNIDYEEHYNFSGRNNFRKLTVEELANELIDGYPSVIEDLEFLKKLAEERYLASRNIYRLFQEYARHFTYEKDSDLYVKQIATLTSLAKLESDAVKRADALQQGRNIAEQTIENMVLSAGQYLKYSMKGRVNAEQNIVHLEYYEKENNIISMCGWAVCNQSRFLVYNIMVLAYKKDTEEYYYIPTHCIHRGDVRNVYRNYCNEGYCGFQCVINASLLGLGTYRIYVYLSNEVASSLVDMEKEFSVEKAVSLDNYD